MHVCAVASRLFKLLYFISQFVFQGVVESSFLFAKVALYNGDCLRREIKNADPVDSVIL